MVPAESLKRNDDAVMWFEQHQNWSVRAKKVRELYVEGLTAARLAGMPARDWIRIRDDVVGEHDEVKAALHNVRRIVWRMYRNFVEAKWHPDSVAARHIMSEAATDAVYECRG